MADNELAERLRHAIETGSFERATSLAQSYGDLIKTRLRAAKTPAEREAIASEASAFLQDRLHLARVMRSHIATEIDAAVRLASYSNTHHSENTWRLDG